MGNNLTQKKDGQGRKVLGSKAVRLLSSMKDLDEKPVDSYDKLVAWMAEMAEHDNMELDTQLFLRQVNRLAKRSKSKDSSSLPFRQNSASCESNTSSATGSKAHSFRQNSASSNASSAAGSTTPLSYARSPHLHPLSALHGGRYTRASFGRQDTVGDDVDDRSAPDTANASVESLCNDSDRELDLSSMTLDEDGLDRNFCSITDALLQHSSDMNQTYKKPFSSSTSNILETYGEFRNAKESKHKRSLSFWDIPRFTIQGPFVDPATVVSSNAIDSCVLDDVLLDQNMADILFSVEALWPTRPK